MRGYIMRGVWLAWAVFGIITFFGGFVFGPTLWFGFWASLLFYTGSRRSRQMEVERLFKIGSESSEKVEEMPPKSPWLLGRVLWAVLIGCSLLWTVGLVAYYTGAMGPDETGWGKDTVDSFGTGRFQIIRTAALDAAGNEELSLYD